MKLNPNTVTRCNENWRKKCQIHSYSHNSPFGAHYLFPTLFAITKVWLYWTLFPSRIQLTLNYLNWSTSSTCTYQPSIQETLDNHLNEHKKSINRNLTLLALGPLLSIESLGILSTMRILNQSIYHPSEYILKEGMRMKGPLK